MHGGLICIAGCGITGSIIARELAEKNYKIFILDRRNHTGGNLYDYTDGYGIRVHKYGPHIFHTNNEDVYKYICRFSDWEKFSLICGSVIDGRCVSVSFDFTAADTFFDEDKAAKIKENLKKEYPKQKTASVLELLESGNKYIKEFAEFLYEKDYKPYTAKQWGIPPEEVDRSIFKRVPVRLEYKQAYFDDKYQLMPSNGYTKFIENIINHENITVILNQDINKEIQCGNDGSLEFSSRLREADKIIYTGAIDELFKYKYGVLPYRSLRFEWKHEDKESFQKYPVTAYPQAEGYTRITEYKKLPVQEVKGTSYAVEYPLPVSKDSGTEPYYPVLTEESRNIYEKYAKLAQKNEKIHLAGRLADFKYINMDEAAARALETAELWS